MQHTWFAITSLRFFLLVVSGLFLAAAFPSPSRSADTPFYGDDSESGAPWRISADRIYLDEAIGDYVAEGNVTISRQGRTLTADRVQYNLKTQQATAKGNVVLLQGQDRLAGSTLDINLETETGILQDGTLFLEQNQIYMSGDQIRKTGAQTYRIKGACLTACEGDTPDWRITSSELDVTLEGYGYAKHTAFWVKKIPLLYAPYFIFPVKFKRQTGLLAPEAGYSQRKGDEYLQPFFWAISDSVDATFYAHYMSRRGLRGGLELRYVLAQNAMGTLMADGFKDRQVDDGSETSSDLWGYNDDAYPRPNEDRYWLRGKMNQPLPAGVTAKLDLDIVSDQDYLHEFRNNADGYKKTNDYFLRTFSRDLDDADDPIRLNLLNLNRIWPQYSLNADLRWYDDVVKRRQAEQNDTLQKLPSLSFDGLRRSIAGSPLYADLTSTYIHFYRPTGDHAQRLDVYPRVYYPFFVFGGVSVEPSAGLRQTFWRIDDDTLPQTDENQRSDRFLYDFQLDLQTELSRAFDLNLAGVDRLSHAIKPQISYTYIPDDEQSQYPHFDSVDAIEQKNLITYGLTNALTARRSETASVSQDRRTSYLTFFRFKVLNGFDINKYNEGDDRPFTDISAELDLTPGRYISLDADAAWSPYDGRFNSRNATLRLWDLRGDWLQATYRYTRESLEGLNDGIETIDLSAELVLGERWRLRGGYEYNFNASEEITSEVGLTFTAGCWAVDIDYTVEEDDRGFMIMFNLKGLGTIGS